MIIHHFELTPETEEWLARELPKHADHYRLRLHDTIQTPDGRVFMITGLVAGGDVTHYTFELLPDYR